MYVPLFVFTALLDWRILKPLDVKSSHALLESSASALLGSKYEVTALYGVLAASHKIQSWTPLLYLIKTHLGLNPV
jgi:hypothetical protein